MKKIMMLILCLSLFLSSITIISSEQTVNEHITETISYTDPIISQNQQFNTVQVTHNDCTSYFVKSGYYVLPVDNRAYTFPKGTIIESIHVQPHDVQMRSIDQELAVCPQAVPLNMQSQLIETNMISDPQHITSWYQSHIGSGIRDQERKVIVNIDVFPTLYQPETNTITSANEFTIMIDYTLPSDTLTSDDNFDLLIIASNEFSASLNPLVDHKNDNAVLTKLVTLEEIYTGEYFTVTGNDDQEQIKYFIKNAIENWGIHSVLLVGGSEKMPVRKTHIQVSSSDRETFISDLYYADIYNRTDDFSSWDTNENGIYAEFNWDGETDEMDLYPDVYISRLACTDNSEVEISVEKIIDFETNEAYTEDWFSDLIVIGGDSFPGDDNEILEGEYVNDEVISIMGGFIPTKLWASNGVLGGASPTGVSAISNRIDQGAGFIDFSGHGNTNVWATHPHKVDSVWLPTPIGGYLNSNIKKLENNEKLPIVVTGACSVGKFNKDDDCFSWSFIPNDEGGAIGSFGATGLGYAYLGEYVTYGLVEKMAVDMFRGYMNGAQTFGEMWSYGLNRNIRSRMDGAEYKTVMEWQAFGDPTLIISKGTEKPAKPTITGPADGRADREYTYEATSTNPSSAELYYVFSWGDDTYSEPLGPFSSGETVTATHTWKDQGDYEIKVAVINEDNMHSDWSNPLPVSMPQRSNKQGSLFDIIEEWVQNYISLNHPILYQILSQWK